MFYQEYLFHTLSLGCRLDVVLLDAWLTHEDIVYKSIDVTRMVKIDNHLHFKCNACILSRQVSKGNWTESNKYVPLVAQPNYFGAETV